MTPETVLALANLTTAIAEAEIAWRGRNHDTQALYTVLAEQAEDLLAKDVRLGEEGARAIRAALIHATARTRGVEVYENPFWTQRDWAPAADSAYTFITTRIGHGN